MKKFLTMVFSVGVAFGCGVGYGFNQAFSSTEQPKITSQAEPRHFSRVEYERLKPGMPLAEVESILDRGIEVNRSMTIATFVWKNSDGSKIIAIFENGKLKSKQQDGLN